jgi:predicted nucleotidyltransferase
MNNRYEKARRVLMEHRKELSKLGSRHLAIFGSTARNEATKKSDIDILVDFDSNKELFEFVDLKFYLEDILSCDVDLVTKQALHPALKQRILGEAKEVY